MADTDTSQTPSPATLVESATPAGSTSSPAPAAEAAAPSAESAQSSAAAPIAEVLEAKTEEATLLGGDAEKNKSPEVKEPVAAETAPENKEVEASQSDEPAPLPTYEAFTLPDGITMDDGKLSEFTKDLGELQNLTKADQSEMQKFGQKLVDRHVTELNAAMQRMQDYYTTTWEKQKSDWKEAFEKDPELGGNRRETTLKAAREFITTHGGSADQQKEFRDLMQSTGLGNHPVMIRLLAMAGTGMSEGKPLPATKPVPTATSKVARRYGQTN